MKNHRYTATYAEGQCTPETITVCGRDREEAAARFWGLGLGENVALLSLARQRTELEKSERRYQRERA